MKTAARQTWAALCSLSVVVSAQGSPDYILPTVTIYGHYGGPTTLFPFVPSIACNPGCPGEVAAMDTTRVWGSTYSFDPRSVAKRNSAMRDVRCVGNENARTTTSANDLVDRWLAAQSAYTNVKNFKNLTSFTKSLPTRVMADGKTAYVYNVTYADNGKESWLLLANADFSSVKMLDDPLPNSFTAGSGNVEAAPAGFCDSLKGSA